MPPDRRRPARAASAIPTAVDPDDELSIPITVAEIRASDTMPPPLMDQLARVAEIGEGLWPLRRRIERIELNIASLAKTGTVHETVLDELRPQLDHWRSATDALNQQLPKLIGMVEGLTHHVRSIDARMRDLELEVRSLGERSTGHADDLASAVANNADLAKRLSVVELHMNNAAVSTVAIAKRDKWWLAGISAAVGAVAGVVPWLYKYLTK